VFKEEVILLQVIQHLPASIDRIHTEVLKAILYPQVAVWKDPVHHHMEALHLAVADHIAAAENQEALILQDHHLVLHPVHHPVEADLQVAEEDLLQADVNL
jgi:hypothetical protein